LEKNGLEKDYLADWKQQSKRRFDMILASNTVLELMLPKKLTLNKHVVASNMILGGLSNVQRGVI
jgi:hypothetical protein